MSAKREAQKNGVEDSMEKTEVDPSQTIHQVRELLFGDSTRALDHRANQLDSKIDRLAAEMNDRFNQVERRISELEAHVEERHLSAIADIGDAIVQLGTSVRSMGAHKAKR